MALSVTTKRDLVSCFDKPRGQRGEWLYVLGTPGLQSNLHETPHAETLLFLADYFSEPDIMKIEGKKARLIYSRAFPVSREFAHSRLNQACIKPFNSYDLDASLLV